MDGLLTCSPPPIAGQRRPTPRVELIGRQVRAVRAHALACLRPQTVDADCTQQARAHEPVPVVRIVIGKALHRWLGIITEALLGSLHQLSHDRVQRQQAIHNVAGFPIVRLDVVDDLALKILVMREIPERVNLLAEILELFGCPCAVHVVTVTRGTSQTPTLSRTPGITRGK